MNWPDTTRTATRFAAMLLALIGCSQGAPATKEGSTASGEGPATFVNRVWRVGESSDGTPGQLYVFLSDGTLVMASPHGKPAFGTWSYEGGTLTMVEEGLPYRVDILRLSETEFRIRSHNPGGAVEIRFTPAEGSPPPDGARIPPTTDLEGFRAPSSRSGRMVLAGEGLRFIACGKGGEGIPVEDVQGGEGKALIRELGAGEREIAVMVRLDGRRLQEIRYAGLEGPDCDRLPPEGEAEARGNEPFWHIRVDGTEASLRTPEKPDGVDYHDGTWSRPDEMRWRYEARRGRGDGVESMTVELTEKRCVDSMSGARYPFQAVLILDGNRLEGCALEGRRARAATG